MNRQSLRLQWQQSLDNFNEYDLICEIKNEKVVCFVIWKKVGEIIKKGEIIGEILKSNQQIQKIKVPTYGQFSKLQEVSTLKEQFQKGLNKICLGKFTACKHETFILHSSGQEYPKTCMLCGNNQYFYLEDKEITFTFSDYDIREDENIISSWFDNKYQSIVKVYDQLFKCSQQVYKSKIAGEITYLAQTNQKHQNFDPLIKIRRMVCSHKQLQLDDTYVNINKKFDNQNWYVCVDCGDLVDYQKCLLAKTHKIHIGLDNKSIFSKAYGQEFQVERIHQLIKNKKIILVLDIDNTLLHTIETDIDKIYDKGPDIYEVRISEQRKHVIKLRSNLNFFFQQIFKNYEIYFFTQGTRSYAISILKLIYFQNRQFFDKNSDLLSQLENNIISRENFYKIDSNNNIISSKNLSKILPNAENQIIILDDRNEVWQRNDKNNFSRNVIFIKGYYYWEVPKAEFEFAQSSFIQNVRNELARLQKSEKQKQQENQQQLQSQQPQPQVQPNQSDTQFIVEENKNNAQEPQQDQQQQQQLQPQQLQQPQQQQQSQEYPQQQQQPQHQSELIQEPQPSSHSSQEETQQKQQQQLKQEQQDIQQSQNQPPKPDNKLRVRKHNDCSLYFCGLMLTQVNKLYFEKIKIERLNPFEMNIIDIYEQYKFNLLKGMKISFSGILKVNQIEEKNDFYQYAKLLGATILKDFQENSTELPEILLCKKPTEQTKKLKTAKKLNIKIINYLWIYYCFIFNFKIDYSPFDFNKHTVDELNNSDKLEELIFQQYEFDSTEEVLSKKKGSYSQEKEEDLKKKDFINQ